VNAFAVTFADWMPPRSVPLTGPAAVPLSQRQEGRWRHIQGPLSTRQRHRTRTTGCLYWPQVIVFRSTRELTAHRAANY
jgi:hypothetical protein